MSYQTPSYRQAQLGGFWDDLWDTIGDTIDKGVDYLFGGKKNGKPNPTGGAALDTKTILIAGAVVVAAVMLSRK